MSESQTRLAFLFKRYYEGSATAAETTEMMALIEASGDDTYISQLMKETWNALQNSETFFSPPESDTLFSSITAPQGSHNKRFDNKNRRVRHFIWLRYAAILILLMGMGIFWKLKNSRNEEKISSATPVKDIPAGGNKAMLTLSDGSTILLDSAGNGLLARQGDTEISKTKSGQLVYNLKGAGLNGMETRINTITTPKGGTYQIVLPDGSKVWLNAASSISFPTMFASNERKVKISGEVYFDVEKDKTKPFLVQFGDAEIEVFGTSFNIKAYHDESSSQTTLIEGSIALKNGKQSKRLLPGQQTEISQNGHLITENVDVNEATAWKDGLFFFKDADVETVMRQVARWYDVEISYEGKVPVRQLTGKVSRNVNISDLLGMLNYTGINCKLQGRKIIVAI